MQSIVARHLVLSVLIAVAGAAGAVDYQRRMIPVIATARPGAYGTVWTTRIMAVGELPDETEVVGFVPTRIPPGFARSFPWDAGVPRWIDEPPGTILYVPAQAEGAVHVSAWLEERALSRQVIPLPVVREQEFSSTTNYFLGITKRSSSRLLLRVYSLDLQAPEATVRVRVQALFEPYRDPWGFIYDQPYRLSVKQKMMSDVEGTVTLPIRPLAVEISLDPLLANIPEGAELAVSVVPEGGLKIWSLLSETDNNTQHVVLRMRD